MSLRLYLYSICPISHAPAAPIPEEIRVSFQRCQFFALLPFAILMKTNILRCVGRNAERLGKTLSTSAATSCSIMNGKSAVGHGHLGLSDQYILMG